MRILAVAVGMALMTTLLGFTHTVGQRVVQADGGSIPPVAPVLANADFECAIGYVEDVNGIGQTIRIPQAWRYRTLTGAPQANSARIQYTGSCDGSGHVERISGEDSFSLRAQDMETPPAPGKPFDGILYQQVSVVPGADYSLSGWALTLCGGSAVPTDCPEDVYMSKMLGLDPTGGMDPEAESVLWVENRRNFVSSDNRRVGWQNLSLAVAADSVTMTVYARISSPFQWHGNHGFIDALSLIRAPTARLEPLPPVAQGGAVTLEWHAEQSPDAASVPDGNYRLLVDIERRVDGGDWRAIPVDVAGAGTRVFVAPCTNRTYEFRVRARTEQPENEDGAWPNHRYPGVWSVPHAVYFPTSMTERQSGRESAAAGAFRLYLPFLQRDVEC